MAGAAATGLAALAFLPAYLRAERLVDRLLYGRRPAPYSVLADVAALSRGSSSDGPNLAGAGSKAWILRVLHDSSAEDLFGKSAGMPKFGKKLTDDEIKQLADLILSQRSAKGSG